MPRDLFEAFRVTPPGVANSVGKSGLLENESRQASEPRDLFEAWGLAAPSREEGATSSSNLPALAEGKGDAGLPGPVVAEGKDGLTLTDKSSASGDWTTGMRDLSDNMNAARAGILTALKPVAKYNPATWFVGGDAEVQKRIDAARANELTQLAERRNLPPEPTNPAYEEWQNSPAASTFSEGASNMKNAMAKDPIGFIRSLSVINLPSSVPSVIGGIVGMLGGPVTAGIGAGLASTPGEFGSRIMDELQRRGVDLKDTEAVREALTIDGDNILSSAAADATLVGFIEGISGGLAGKVATGPIRSAITRETLGTGIEATGGAAGEAATQVRQTGGVDNWNAVFGEFVGEGVAGGAMTAGQMGIHSLKGASAKYISKPSKVLSEEELKRLWEESNPEQPISTYTEATNAGRTLYGFVDDSKPGPVEVSDYKSAEIKAGLGDFRRGRLVAVSEADVQTISSLGDTAVLASDAVANGNSTTPGVSAVFKAVSAGKSSWHKTELLKTYLAANKAGKQVLDAGGTSVEAIAVAKQVFDTAPGFQKRVFSGDAKQFQITPRTDNALYFERMRDSGGTIVPLRGVMAGNASENYQSIDLDKLQETAAAKGWLVVPSARVEAYTRPTVAALLDGTFNFATPEAKSDFMVADTTQMEALFATGQVSWKGRLDARFLGRGTSGTGFQVIEKATAKKLRYNELFAEVAPQLIDARTPPMPGDYWQTSSKDAAVSKDIDRLWNDLAQGKTDPVIGFGASPNHAKYQALITEWYKKFNGNRKVVFITNDGLTGYSSILDNYPALKKEIISLGYLGFYWGINPDIHIVVINDMHADAIYGPTSAVKTLAHEFGHLMSAERLMGMPLDQLLQLHAAWQRMSAAISTLPGDSDKARYTNAAANAVPYINSTGFAAISGNSAYQMQFEEWIAEQMTKQMFSNAKDLGRIARHLRAIAKEIVAFLRRPDIRKLFEGTSAKPEPEFEAFVNSLKETKVVYEPAIVEALKKLEAKKAAATYPTTELPMSEFSVPIRQVFNKHLGPLSPNKQMAKTIANGLDKFNWFYKWASNLRQLAEANPHITQLQLVREFFAFAKNDTSRILIGAEETIMKWRALGADRGKQLTEFLFALDQMEYLSPAEKQKNVRRWPSQQEFIALAKQYKIDGEMQSVYREVRDFFLNSVKRQEELQLMEANRITDPAAQAAAIKAAKQISIELIKKPYFPQTRFGKWALTVRDANKKLLHFELFETKGELKSAGEQAATAFPGSMINLSTVPEETLPFVGVPTWLLDQIRTMPGLSTVQQDWIDQFRYMISPTQSFRKHLMKRKGYSGFSHDGQRVFAHYAFHHARFYSRIKYDDGVRTAIDSLRRSAGDVDNPAYVTPRVEMADFLERMYKEWRNPGEDWAKLRQFTAIWHLGFVPRSAIINMTQVPLATVPWLSSKFGGVAGEKAVLNAARKLSTYYRKGNLVALGTDEAKAIQKAVDDGYIDESMAAELAAMAMGGGAGNQIGKAMAGDKFQRGYMQFTEKAMWMFRMAEQWNRRVTFRAAYQLAIENPSAKYVVDLRNKYILKYDELHKAGWVDREILAYLAGIDTIEGTQYTYDREARPRFMQGRKSAFFAFQLFTQQTLWMLWNNKEMMSRYILYTMLIGGSMGLVPDDAEELTKGIAYWLFGKDFNLERETRKYVNDLIGDEYADLILHGTARYGFGVSKLMHMLGADFVPDVDLSGSATLNQILPVSIRGLATPGADWQDFVSQQSQNVAGATFGIPLAMLRAISATDLEIDDFKRWESAMPAAFRNVTVAGRRLAEGGERTRNYERTLAYDGEDPEQAAELIAKAMGFRSLRESRVSEMVRMEREITAFWQTRKELLLRAAYRAQFIHKDKEEYKEIIEEVKKFNNQSPDPKLKITGETLKNSFRRRLQMKQKIESGQGTAPPAVRNEVDQLYPGVREISRKTVQ